MKATVEGIGVLQHRTCEVGLDHSRQQTAEKVDMLDDRVLHLILRMGTCFQGLGSRLRISRSPTMSQWMAGDMQGI